MPGLIAATNSAELHDAFENLVVETFNQMVRTEKTAESLDEILQETANPAVQALLEQGKEIICHMKLKSPVSDLALIFAAQKMEHQGLTRYAGLLSWANHMNYNEALNCLEENYLNGKATDEKLTEISERILSHSEVVTGPLWVDWFQS